MTQLSASHAKRVIAVLAGLAAAGLVLSGCTSSGGGTDDAGASFDFTGKDKGAMSDFAVGTTFTATEPVEFSMLYRDHEAYPLQKDWPFFTEIEKNQKVTFDIDSSPRVCYEDARSAMIASGDAPEIITVVYPGQETPFVSGGAILPVSDFTKYMPNFTDKVKKWGLQKDLDNLRQADGKFYVLPGLSEIAVPQYSYVVRKDIWDKLGLSLQPATFDDFQDELEKVHEAYPDKDVISDEFNSPDPLGGALNFAAPSFGTTAGWGLSASTGGWWDGSKYVYAAASDEYKQLISYYHGLVADGLMTKGSVTQSDDDAKASFFNGDSLVISGNDQFLTQARQSFSEVGNDDAEVALLRVAAGPAGDNLAAGGRVEGLPGIMISSSAADSDHFKALLQFVDWLYYSDEGLEFSKWGVKGLTYTVEDGKRVLTDDWDRAKDMLNPGATKMLNVDGGFANGAFMAAEGSTEELRTSMMLPETKDFVSSMLTKKQLETAPAAPLTEIENEQASLWMSALLDVVRQNTAAFITGDRPLSEWDAYVQELKNAHMDEYVDMLNKAQKRQAEALAGDSQD